MKAFAHVLASSLIVHAYELNDFSEPIQVHFVPHSHMDAGWRKTYDEYYNNEVTQIFDSVFALLQTNRMYTYTLGDIAFFRRYWLQLDPLETEDARQNIRQLVENGQLEFVHGGYVSHDEATTNYADVLRNFEAGHDFLKNEFGVTPRVAWQLDPFGHSAVTASLAADMGIEAIFFARLNKEKYDDLAASEDLEFIWKPTFASNEILAHALHDHYNPPDFVDRELHISKDEAWSQAS